MNARLSTSISGKDQPENHKGEGSTPSARRDSASRTNENGLAARAGTTSQNLRGSASCQAVPARIGPEALTVALRQSFELGADVGGPTRARVVHGPATERREAGREDHGAVEDILIRHHALAQTGDADVEHGKNEAVRHLLRGLGHLALLHRLPAPPFVEAPAALAAEVTHLDLVA